LGIRGLRDLLSGVWPELILGAAIGVSYMFVVPLWEAPDEPSHYGNIAYVRKYGVYPLTFVASKEMGMYQGETSQPPLYYWITEFLTRSVAKPRATEVEPVGNAPCRDDPWRFRNIGETTWPRTMRAVSLFFLLLAGLTASAAAKIAFRDELSLPGTVMSVFWLVPQVMFTGAVISNDSLAMAGGSLLLLLWSLALRAPSLRRMLLLGTVGMVVLFTKFNLLPLFLAGVVYSLFVSNSGIRRRMFFAEAYLIPGLWTTAIALLVFPDQVRRLTWLVGTRIEAQFVGPKVLPIIASVWETYWGRFGWMNVSMGTVPRLIFWTLTIILLLGATARLTRKKSGRNLAIIASGMIIAEIVALLVDLGHSAQGQGRHLFPGAGAFSLLGALAIGEYVGGKRARWVGAFLAILSNGYVLGVVLPSAYSVTPPDMILGTASCRGTDITPCLRSGQPESETFTSALPGLTRVGLVPATFDLPLRGQVELSLLDMSSGVVVETKTMNASEMQDGRFLYLDFPPISNSEGREYSLSAQTKDGVKGSLAFFLSMEDVCPDAFRNSGPGDLRFVSYHSYRGDGIEK